MSFSVSPPISGSLIQLYKYETFGYTIGYPVTPASVSFAGTSAFISAFLKDNSTDPQPNATFSGTFLASSGNQEPLVITVTDSTSAVYTFSIKVTIGNGRLTTTTPGPYVFYQSENVNVTYSGGITFNSPITLTDLYSTPALPVGISLLSSMTSNSFQVSGYPAATYSPSNYLLVGQNTNTADSNYGKVVTLNVNIQVKGERIVITPPVYGPIINVGVPYTPQTFTATFPGNVSSFTWLIPALPNGFTLTPNANTLTLTGNVTTATANQYIDYGFSNVNVSVVGVQPRSSGNISNTLYLSFPFGESVVFRSASGSSLSSSLTSPVIYAGTTYSDLPVMKVNTYFSNVASMVTSLSPTDLGNGLTLSLYNKNNVYGNGIVYLSGKATNYGSSAYTFTASNTNNKTGSINLTIPITQDVIRFDSNTPADGSVFYPVFSRDLPDVLTGPIGDRNDDGSLPPSSYSYTTANLNFNATSSTGNSLQYTALAKSDVNTVVSLSSYGLTFGKVTSNSTYSLYGTPLLLGDLFLYVTATNPVTSVSSTTSIHLIIQDDVITNAKNPPGPNTYNGFDFVGNLQLTPYQVTASTLSGRPIKTFLPGDNFLKYLKVSKTGIVSGLVDNIYNDAPYLYTDPPSGPWGVNTDGSYDVPPYELDITLSTGFKSFVNGIVFNYCTFTRDSCIYLPSSTVYSLTQGNVIPPIPLNTIVYSGSTPTFTLTNDLSNNQFYGLTIDSNAGIIGGTLVTGVLPSNIDYSIDSIVDNKPLSDSTHPSLKVNITTTNPIVNRSFVFSNSLVGSTSRLLFTDYQPSGTTFSNYSTPSDTYYFTDLQTYSGTWYLATTSKLLKSTDGIHYSNTVFENIYNVFYDSGNWFGAGMNGVTLSIYNLTTNTALPTPVIFVARSPGLNNYPNTYTQNGLSFRGKNGIFIIGALTNSYIYKSSTWTPLNGITPSQIGCINLDSPDDKLGNSYWIIAGSDKYKPKEAYDGMKGPATTIFYSHDHGTTWTGITGAYQGFNYAAYDIVYEPNGFYDTEAKQTIGIWIATGVSYSGTQYVGGLAFSTDGTNWTNIQGFEVSSSDPLIPNIGIGPIQYDPYDSRWYVFVNTDLWYHDNVTSLETGWKLYQANIVSVSDSELVFFSKPKTISQGTPQSIMTITNVTAPTYTGNEPIFTSPAQTTYYYWQFLPADPIYILTDNPLLDYVYVDINSLPQGLKFDPVNYIISGTPSEITDKSVFVYATRTTNDPYNPITYVSKIVLSFQVRIPFDLKQQSSASAFTSLVRQAAIVNGAEYSVNSKAYPANVSTLGSFAAPAGQDTIKDKLPCNC